MELVVLNCCVTATNDVDLASSRFDDLGEVHQRPCQAIDL